ncbi:MAG TPA: hypothetical protein DCP92_15225 [Nitrospiraceae bacterium]|nr:hypothetical protein [Nitrospiraceae bacterium]
MTSKGATAGVTGARASHKDEPTKTTTTTKGDSTMEAKTGFAGYDTQNVSENVLKMMKFSLDTTFDSIAKVQEFNDKLVKEMIRTNKQVQADTEKVVGEWIENGKKGWDEYKKTVEDGYKKFEGFLQPQK